MANKMSNDLANKIINGNYNEAELSELIYNHMIDIWGYASYREAIEQYLISDDKTAFAASVISLDNSLLIRGVEEV